MWWNPPQASATQTSPIFTSSVLPYDVVQRSESSGSRWIDTNVPAARSTPIRNDRDAARSGETPRGADPARAARRRPRGSGRRRPRASPSTRCTQSAISVSARRVRLGRPGVPRASSPETSTSASRKAGQRRSGASSTHASTRIVEADREPEASSRGTRSRSASPPRTATGRRRAGRRTSTWSAFAERITNPRCRC